MKRDSAPLNPFAALPSYKRIPMKRAKPRRGPLRDRCYLKWLRWDNWCHIGEFITGSSQQCSAILGGCDPAHTQNNGQSSKGPDSSCVPLCRTHHREYDANRKVFEKKYGVNMKALAAQYWDQYQRESRDPGD